MFAEDLGFLDGSGIDHDPGLGRSDQKCRKFRAGTHNGTRPRHKFSRQADQTARPVTVADFWGTLCLSFAHHGDHLDSTQDYTCMVGRLEAQHRSNPFLDGVVILPDPVIEIGTLPAPDWLQLASRPILEPTCRITGQTMTR
jgi:hypothetical protein